LRHRRFQRSKRGLDQRGQQRIVSDRIADRRHEFASQHFRLDASEALDNARDAILERRDLRNQLLPHNQQRADVSAVETFDRRLAIPTDAHELGEA
jgi:hypothetical protein